MSYHMMSTERTQKMMLKHFNSITFENELKPDAILNHQESQKAGDLVVKFNNNTLEMLEKINIDLAFIGVSGCSIDAGFTCGTESDMLVKRLMIEKARTSVLMCSREKLNCLMPYTFAKLSDVDYLISDEPMPDAFEAAAREAGITLL